MGHDRLAAIAKGVQQPDNLALRFNQPRQHHVDQEGRHAEEYRWQDRRHAA